MPRRSRKGRTNFGIVQYDNDTKTILYVYIFWKYSENANIKVIRWKPNTPLR